MAADPLSEGEGERIGLLLGRLRLLEIALHRVDAEGWDVREGDAGGENRRALVAFEVGAVRAALEVMIRADLNERLVEQAEVNTWISLPRQLQHQDAFVRRRP